MSATEGMERVKDRWLASGRVAGDGGADFVGAGAKRRFRQNWGNRRSLMLSIPSVRLGQQGEIFCGRQQPEAPSMGAFGLRSTPEPGTALDREMDVASGQICEDAACGGQAHEGLWICPD